MGARGRRWALVLAVALAVEVLIAGPRRLERASGAWAGDLTWTSAEGVVALLWLPVLCAVVVLGFRAAPTPAPLVAAGVPTLRRSGRAWPGRRWRGRARAGREPGASAVRALLRPGGFVAVGQPVLGLHSGAVVGIEALARFPGPGSPETWFARAAAVGLGPELELVALQHAFGLSAALPEGAYLSVNASPHAIADPRFPDLLASAPLPMSRLVLEVTEHDEVSEYGELLGVLEPLRRAGVRLAVDDVGAGYASFRHVLELRPDIIKLDRSIVSRVDSHDGCRAVVTAFVLVALELGASVTAEGVETEAQLGAVDLLGADAVQGYLVGRPGSAPGTWLPGRSRTAQG